MPFLNAGGVSLHYQYEGGAWARPLVFVNSLGTDFRIWDDLVERLDRTRTVLRYDKRGHGLSDVGGVPHSINDHVEDLESLFRHLGLVRAVVCGLSVGGLIAIGFAARNPEKVDGLILADTGHKIGSAESWNSRIRAVEEAGIHAIADGVLGKWFTPDFRLTRPADLAGYRNMLTRQPAQGYAATCAAVRDADYTSVARSIRALTLCLVGDRDEATPPSLMQSLAALIPQSRLVLIRGAAHIPCVEQPETMGTLIAGFLSSLNDAR